MKKYTIPNTRYVSKPLEKEEWCVIRTFTTASGTAAFKLWAQDTNYADAHDEAGDNPNLFILRSDAWESLKISLEKEDEA